MIGTLFAVCMRASVVVPTRDRLRDLSRCLAALAAQSVPRGDYEVIVVDDGSREPVADALDRRLREGVTFLRRDSAGGPAEARNEGIVVAKGGIIAFTDDDCVPEAGWLDAGCRTIERGLDIATGRTFAEPGERGPFAYTMEQHGPDPRFSTCNCFYRRDVLTAAGGFRSAFFSSAGHHFGEDTDLAWRAIERGARAGFAPHAIVRHAVRPQRFVEYLRARRRLENIVPLVKRHPGVKAAHLSKHLYSWSHLLVYLALAGLLAAFLTPWALLLLAPYALWRTRRKRRLLTAPWDFLWTNRALPQYLVADVYECWVFARASLRHRHVFL